ncbi:zinc finger and SCAN domain-containing protein 4-like isoform X2 [Toxorhynchites rutilus septentrionalis]|nr:zinc finger and SCAN domain-containing protein 4-like isoform X2 [Toxorhynchites rutilus septentrionalis]XP_055617361.1 zinc finger and SCAN domain-containing protein 4-like isoform X2 [Toxorhynchites rutilus septentrionalis]
MEIQTITLERWMCRVCFSEGSYNIFEDQLAPLLQLSSAHQGHQIASKFLLIVDALNCFSEFKILQTEVVNEPAMLCKGCCDELVQCYRFRIKLNESECMLRKDPSIQDQVETKDDEDGKTGLTLQFADIEPNLEDNNDQSPGQAQDGCDEQVPAEPKKLNKTHHARPRFQLTSQVSNILRHVAMSSRAFPGGEKRRVVEDIPGTTTPKKIQRKNIAKGLDETLVVPEYLFDPEGNVELANKVLSMEEEVILESTQTHCEGEMDGKNSEGIYYCKHCPKAFSAPYHLLSHTKNTHLCQHCHMNFPNALARNKHIREKHNLFQCSLCSFKTQYNSNLRSHQRKVHSIVSPGYRKS